MHLETEFKFVGTEETLSRLRQSPAFVKLAGTRLAQTKQVFSVYYDTKDLSLRKSGLALRVRSEGHGFVQTVKSLYRRDLATRLEYKAKVSNKKPRVAAIPEKTMRRFVGEAVGRQPLHPVFDVEMVRTKVLLSPKPGTEIEAAIDNGVIRPAGERNGPSHALHEFELELVRGDVRDLVACARELTQGLPLTLSLQSRSQIGFALSDGEPDPVIFGSGIEIPKGCSTGDALCITIARCLEHFLGNRAPVYERRDYEGLHQMRVALRLLRSAFALLPSTLRAHFDPLHDQLRTLSSTLGAARDLDVFTRELLQPVTDTEDSAALAAFSRIVEDQRVEAWNRVIAMLDSQAFRHLMFELAAVTYERSWLTSDETRDLSNQNVQKLAARRLERRHAQVLPQGRNVVDLSASERHELRIDLKKLRYAIEVVGSLFAAGRVASMMKHLRKLQDHLGSLNDTEVARNVVAHILRHTAAGNAAAELNFAGGLVVGWHNAHARKRFKRLKSEWDEFEAVKPFWRKGPQK